MTDVQYEQQSLLPLTDAQKRQQTRRRRSEDPCWEALIRATKASPAVERDILNVALKAIKAVCERDGIVDVPSEIERRAAAYQAMMPNCMLTPMALAKHWNRVLLSAPVSAEQAAISALRSSTHGEVRL